MGGSWSVSSCFIHAHMKMGVATAVSASFKVLDSGVSSSSKIITTPSYYLCLYNIIIIFY